MPRPVEIIAVLRDSFTAPGKAVTETVRNIGKGVDDAGRKTSVFSTALKALGAVAGGVAKAFGAVFSALTSVKSILLAAGAAFAASRLVQSIKSAADQIDALGALSGRTGIGAKALSELQVAAKINNIEFTSFSRLLGTLNRQIGQLRQGTAGSATRRAFAELGIDSATLNGQSAILDILPKIADGLKNARSEAEKTALASALFGRNYGDALQLLGEGAPKLESALATVRRFRLELTQSQLDAADKLTDALDLLNFAALKLKAVIIEQLEPFIIPVLEKIIARLSSAADIVRNFGALFSTALLGGERQESATLQLLASLGAVRDAVVAVGRAAFEILKGIVVSFFSFVIDFVINGFGPALTKAITQAVLDATSVVSGAIQRSIAGIQIALDGIAQGLEFVDQFNPSIANKITIGILNSARSVTPAINQMFAGIQVAADQTSKALDKIIKRVPTRSDIGKTLDDNFGLGQSTKRAGQILRQAKNDLVETFIAANNVGAEINKLKDEIPEAVAPPSRSEWDIFFDAITSGGREVFDLLSDIGEQGRLLGQTLAKALTDDLATALSDVIVNAKNLKDAFVDLARQTVQALLQIILRLLIVRALSSALGGTGVGNFLGIAASAANKGGLIRGFSSGGFVPGGGPDRDSVFAKLTTGEFVQRRRAVQFYGVDVMRALNAMAVPRDVLRAYAKPVGAHFASRGFFNAGGQVGTSGAPSSESRPVLVMTERDYERFVAGSGDARRRQIEVDRTQTIGTQKR